MKHSKKAAVSSRTLNVDVKCFQGKEARKEFFLLFFFRLIFYRLFSKKSSKNCIFSPIYCFACVFVLVIVRFICVPKNFSTEIYFLFTVQMFCVVLYNSYVHFIDSNTIKYINFTEESSV